jgi:hypothetical protein
MATGLRWKTVRLRQRQAAMTTAQAGVHSRRHVRARPPARRAPVPAPTPPDSATARTQPSQQWRTPYDNPTTRRAAACSWCHWTNRATLCSRTQRGAQALRARALAIDLRIWTLPKQAATAVRRSVAPSKRGSSQKRRAIGLLARASSRVIWNSLAVAPRPRRDGWRGAHSVGPSLHTQREFVCRTRSCAQLPFVSAPRMPSCCAPLGMRAGSGQIVPQEGEI